MSTNTELARLLQLASPTLPVGAFSYSQGLEAAVEAGIVHHRESAQQWIEDVLALSVARMEAPILVRLIAAWQAGDHAAAGRWNDDFLASRETHELRAETVQMGYSLRVLLAQLEDATPLEAIDEASFPVAFAYAVARWQIDAHAALVAYLWAWLENQVMAAVKAVPLGQTDGQRILLALGARLDAIAGEAESLEDEALGAYAPGLALFSSRHETQYSRLFRS
ncbi:MAG: urease accessory protein UreF [Betaproteobacteria bacterium SG8_39]|nr:MAG: urease accessory protein UreF [Betaproteobacteria bacterium SG8_39]